VKLSFTRSQRVTGTTKIFSLDSTIITIGILNAGVAFEEAI